MVEPSRRGSTKQHALAHREVVEPLLHGSATPRYSLNLVPG